MDQIIAMFNDFLASTFGKAVLGFFNGSFNFMYPANAPAASE